jgi:hypothetical protein
VTSGAWPCPWAALPEPVCGAAAAGEAASPSTGPASSAIAAPPASPMTPVRGRDLRMSFMSDFLSAGARPAWVMTTVQQDGDGWKTATATRAELPCRKGQSGPKGDQANWPGW